MTDYLDCGAVAPALAILHTNAVATICGVYKNNLRGYMNDLRGCMKNLRGYMNNLRDRMNNIRGHTVPSAVAEIYRETDEKPDQQSQPVLGRQCKHQQQTNRDAKNRHERNKRHAKRPLRIGVRAAHYEHRSTNDHKRK